MDASLECVESSRSDAIRSCLGESAVFHPWRLRLGDATLRSAGGLGASFDPWSARWASASGKRSDCDASATYDDSLSI